jgi:hypothetical protein
VVRLRFLAVALVVAGCLAGTASAASALTLGDTAAPGGAAATPDCVAAFFTQDTTDPMYSYTVPTGGGSISSWSTNTSVAVAGSPLSLVIVRPGSGSDTIIAADSETLPNPLPAGGVTTFDLTQPIAVASGDVLGLWSSNPFSCYITGGSILAEDAAFGQQSAPAPSPGGSYTPTTTFGYEDQALLNVSVNLVQSDDVSITGTAAPSSIIAGGAAEYAFTVGNATLSEPITFTDTVPAGVTILSAVAGSGTCSTAGHTVTCTIPSLASGSSAPVSIIVAAPSAGTYPDTATVSSPLTDPTPANNSATTTLTVTPATVASAPSCKTVNLAGAPLAVAKAVIPALNCTLGKTTKKSSKTVHKGDVISTTPGHGKTLADGTKVNIVVSSGPPPKKKKKKKKR